MAITSGSQLNYARSPDNPIDLGNGYTGGGKWVGGTWQEAAPGMGWNSSGQLVNIAQAQMGQQAQNQAQQDLAGFGSPAQIASQSAAAADPFASQRGQYQNSLANLMNGQFSTSDPSYAWRVGQGQQALERSAAAKGYLGSGNILAELQNYGQNQGSQEYQNQYNRLLPLTGATTGSPGTAGATIAATYGWRNNALANLGGAQQMQQGVPGGGGGSGMSFSTQGANSYRPGTPMDGSGSGIAGGAAGGGGSFNPSTAFGGGGGGGGLAGGDLSGSSAGHSLGYDPAYSDMMLQRQLAAGGGYNSATAGGGLINMPSDNDNANEQQSLQQPARMDDDAWRQYQLTANPKDPGYMTAYLNRMRGI
jgi:hypothetical protein